MVVKRITMFTMDEEGIKAVLEQYHVLLKDAKKDGKPYIISLNATRLHDDPRSQGYTFAAHSEFASMEDMAYYDNECEAHKALKAVAGPRLKSPPMTIYWDA